MIKSDATFQRVLMKYTNESSQLINYIALFLISMTHFTVPFVISKFLTERNSREIAFTQQKYGKDVEQLVASNGFETE